MAKDCTIEPLIDSIQNIKSVQLVVEMTNEKIHNKEHLVF